MIADFQLLIDNAENPKKVSVIIPNYNYEKYIIERIDSVLMQTYPIYEIVILDEPFSGLDPVNSKILQDVVTELIEEGRIVIFSSHQMSYVEEFCEDIAIINNGEIALSGDIADIKAEYGKNQLIISAVGMGAEELAEKLKTSCEDTLSVTGIHKDGVIVKNIQELSGNALIKEIMNADIEIASFDSYRPSLNDIFVKAVGGDR